MRYSGTVLGSARQEGWHAAPTAVAASSGPAGGHLALCCLNEKGHNLLRVLEYKATPTCICSVGAQCPPGVVSNCYPLCLGRWSPFDSRGFLGASIKVSLCFHFSSVSLYFYVQGPSSRGGKTSLTVPGTGKLSFHQICTTGDCEGHWTETGSLPSEHF